VWFLMTRSGPVRMCRRREIWADKMPGAVLDWTARLRSRVETDQAWTNRAIIEEEKTVRVTGKIRSMGATLALASVMILGACDSGGGSNAGKSNSDLLKEASKNMRELKSYRLDADVSAGGQDVKMKGDIDSSNKNLKLEMEAAGQNINVIALADKAYVSTDGGGTFTEVPGSQASSLTGAVDQFSTMWTQMTDAEIDKVKDQLKDGSPATETIDGKETKHMTGDIKSLSALSAATGSTPSEGTIDIWVDTGSPAYVRQMKIDATTDGQETDGIIKWSNFNETFDIKAP
jgi:hypothetical protein